MGKIGKIWLLCTSMLFIAFMAVMIQTFRPVRNVQPDDVMKIDGWVTGVKEGPGFDIIISLKNDTHHYYINRGLQHNLTIQQLQEQLFNQSVTLYVVKRWTIFTRDNNMGHISKLVFNEDVLFNEISE